MNAQYTKSRMCPRAGAVLLVVSAAVLIPSAIGARGATTPEDRKAVRAVLDAQAAAWNKGDLDGFMAGYWNNEKLTFISGGEIRRGWKTTKERYEKRYQADGKDKLGQLSFTELEVEIFGPEAALVHGKYTLVRGEKSDTGRFTLALRKFADGWRIVHDHTSQ